MRIVLVGGGKFAGIIYSLFSNRHDFIGYIDDICGEAYVETHYQLRKIGKIQDCEKILSLCKNCVISIGGQEAMLLRLKCYERYFKAGFNFPTLIHSSADVASNASIDTGSIIRDRAIIHPMAKIGKNCVISTNVIIGHDSIIGNNVFITPGAIISGSVIIGDNTFVGTGAIIIQNVKVGKNCLIAAGACVIKDVSDNTKVAGVPAKQIS